MIGTIDIKLNAARPDIPLAPFYAFINSPSQVRIVNVPRAIGKWSVSKVFITANYPDNAARSVECVLDGGCWHGTIPASAATGISTNGFTITANGVAEDGTTAVTGYVLGKGDVEILNTDGTITVGTTTYYLHLLDAQPATAHKGDVCVIGGAWKIYNGTEWVALGGGGGDISHSDFADVETIDERYTMNTIKDKVNEVLQILKGTAGAVAIAVIPFFATGAEVLTNRLDALYNDSILVTNVSFVGLATEAAVAAKQDALPFATNAIPAAVVTDAPWLTAHQSLAPATNYVDAVAVKKTGNQTITADSFTVMNDGRLGDIQMQINGDSSEFYATAAGRALMYLNGGMGAGITIYSEAYSEPYIKFKGLEHGIGESYEHTLYSHASGDIAVTDDLTNLVDKTAADSTSVFSTNLLALADAATASKLTVSNSTEWTGAAANSVVGRVKALEDSVGAANMLLESALNPAATLSASSGGVGNPD